MGDGEQSTLSHTQPLSARQKVSVRTKVEARVWELCLPDPH